MATWLRLPSDLMELQISQIDLLMAMYPDEVVLDQTCRELLEHVRNGDLKPDEGSTHPVDIDLTLHLAMRHVNSHASPSQDLRIHLTVPFAYQGNKPPLHPPTIKVRMQQPPWMPRATSTQITSAAPTGEDFLGTIDHLLDAATRHLQQSHAYASASTSSTAVLGCTSLVRVWFHFPSISTRAKRQDLTTYAPGYALTGVLYAGKPGFLCLEGSSADVDAFMKFIKTESWSDVPPHQKKVTERFREQIDRSMFGGMQEITDMLGERRGARVNRGDMRAVEEWFVGKGLGETFAKVLMS